MEGAYDTNKPLFTFVFPDGETTGPATTAIDLTPVADENGKMSAQTWDFVRRLMLIPEDYATNKNWDGYTPDKDSLYRSEKKWQQHFHGVYIKPVLEGVDKTKRGSFYGFELAASGLQLQGRSRNPLDPTLIKDTIGANYYFYDETIEPSVDEYGNKYEGIEGAMNISVNSVSHDYTGSLVSKHNFAAYDSAGNKLPNSSRDEVDVCFVEGAAGIATEIYFTDEFLAEIKAAYNNENDGSKYRAIGVNQCRLYVYLKSADCDVDYDWNINMQNAHLLTPLLNNSMVRLGTYTKDYSRLNCIVDYNPDYETQYSAELPYGGYLNRSRCCYELDITGFMQHMCNYVNSLENIADYDESVTPRSLYLGPEALTPYSFDHAVLQGSTSEVSPIHLELTYTMVK